MILFVSPLMALQPSASGPWQQRSLVSLMGSVPFPGLSMVSPQLRCKMGPRELTSNIILSVGS